MPKLIKGKEKLINLPKAKPIKLLPPPKVRMWLAVTLMAIPVLFILIYAVLPWFHLSTGTVAVLVWIVIIVFLLGTIVLLVMMLKIFYNLVREKFQQARQGSHIVVYVLLLLLTLMFCSAIFSMLQ